MFWKDLPSGDVPITGLSAATSHRATCLGPEDRKPVRLNLAPENDTLDGPTFREVDAALMPGLYGFRVPPALRSSGYLFVYFEFQGARPLYILLKSVAYDRHDRITLGLGTWTSSNSHDHLTGGLRKSMPELLKPLLKDWLKPY
jgi:hypothetical protein